MKVFELTPINGRKSFNGKCKVLESNTGISKLISYETEVAMYDQNTNKMTVYSRNSQTTQNHINAFLNFYGFETCNKKELENYNK